MSAEIMVILDDRLIPPPEISVSIGSTPFSEIRLSRRQLKDEISMAAESVQSEFCIIRSDKDAEHLAQQIENKGAGHLYLRIPAFISPVNFSALPNLIEKARFALETTFVAPISVDDAPAILDSSDAPKVLRARTSNERRAFLLKLAESSPTMVDHLQTCDLRKPQALLFYLSGSTEARHFNQIEADNGVFKKSSSNLEKMKDEYRFFHIVPEQMKRYLLPTFDYWEKQGRAGYSMEHLLMPDVSTQLIHGALTPHDFELLLDHFFSFLSSREKGKVDHQGTYDAGIKHIVGKLDHRLQQLQEMEVGTKLNAILNACGPLGNIEDMRMMAKELITSELKRVNMPQLVLGHGDPCFSNIIFDRRLGLMRLIDPKGASSIEDAWMHPLYDLAKFSHSILGAYDYINNGLFACRLDDELDLQLVLDQGGTPEWAKLSFIKRLDESGYDYAAIRSIELSLFLSMLPLHINNPKKLAGFALTAASIFNEFRKKQ